MKFRRLAVPALLLAVTLPAFAADCRPEPLPGRTIYLRGTFNDWRADDESALSYVCDHYELVTRLSGEQSFKLGDEDWAFDFGSPSDAAVKPGVQVVLAAKGPALKATFHGVARLSLTPGPAPSLLLTELPADTPLPPPAPSSITDPVALSLAFDSQDADDKAPYGAVPVGTDVALSLGALPGVEAVTLVIEKRRLEGNYDVLQYDELARVPLARASAGADGREHWRGHFRFDAPAVYGYWFEATVGGRTVIVENNATPIY